jgi:acetyl-CoA acyltransferase 1
MTSQTNSKDDKDVVIVSAVRTPLCRARKGKLAKVPPSTLLSAALKGCLEAPKRADGTIWKGFVVEAKAIEDICIGNVLAPASGYAAIRMSQLASDIPFEASISTVNRQCSSGLQAIANIAAAIQAGTISIGIAGGVESMSCHPMNSVKPPDVDWDVMQEYSSSNKQGDGPMDCLIPMGVTSENVAKKYGLNRQKLDAFAAKSHQKAANAQKHGLFQAEIVPVGNVTQDDGIRPSTTAESLSKLRAVFDKSGKGFTTAGNASQMTDGASAVLMMTRGEAQRRGLQMLGVWRGFAVQGVPPRIMGIGPAVAIPKVLQQCNLSTQDIDVYELNEAFASQATWCIDELGLDERKVNPNGGAIALGHPLGCTGSRQVATLLHELHRRPTSGGKSQFGVVSMCIGTGMGAAAVLEVESDPRKEKQHIRSLL